MVHKEACKTSSYTSICAYSTPMIRRGYFIKKVQQANNALARGNTDQAIVFFIHAMAACSKPAVLLECMSTSLPLHVYQKLLDRLTQLV